MNGKRKIRDFFTVPNAPPQSSGGGIFVSVDEKAGAIMLRPELFWLEFLPLLTEVDCADCRRFSVLFLFAHGAEYKDDCRHQEGEHVVECSR